MTNNTFKFIILILGSLAFGNPVVGLSKDDRNIDSLIQIIEQKLHNVDPTAEKEYIFDFSKESFGVDILNVEQKNDLNKFCKMVAETTEYILILVALPPYLSIDNESNSNSVVEKFTNQYGGSNVVIGLFDVSVIDALNNNTVKLKWDLKTINFEMSSAISANDTSLWAMAQKLRFNFAKENKRPYDWHISYKNTSLLAISLPSPDWDGQYTQEKKPGWDYVVVCEEVNSFLVALKHIEDYYNSNLPIPKIDVLVLSAHGLGPGTCGYSLGQYDEKMVKSDENEFTKKFKNVSKSLSSNCAIILALCKVGGDSNFIVSFAQMMALANPICQQIKVYGTKDLISFTRAKTLTNHYAFTLNTSPTVSSLQTWDKKPCLTDYFCVNNVFSVLKMDAR